MCRSNTVFVPFFNDKRTKVSTQDVVSIMLGHLVFPLQICVMTKKVQPRYRLFIEKVGGLNGETFLISPSDLCMSKCFNIYEIFEVLLSKYPGSSYRRYNFLFLILINISLY